MTMEAAREAVAKFTSKVGHHTDVEELVNPAVTHEVVKPTRHETITEAIDREVHQHHYHTTVQPITHREILPEKHVHNLIPVVKKEFQHGDHDAVKRGVSAEISQFANKSIVHETQHTRAAAAAVTGEHVHHHVHETVQPIIHKETIQPEVVHTTIPIHEVHHAEATHHGMSALPMKTLDEFTKAGGILVGSSRHTHEEYVGAPRPYNRELQTTAEKVLGGVVGHHNTAGRSSMSDVERREYEQHQNGLGRLSHSSSDMERRELEHQRTGVAPTTTTTTSTNTSTAIKSHRKRDSGVGSVEGVHNGQLSH